MLRGMLNRKVEQPSSTIHNSPLEQGQLAAQVLERVDRDNVWIAIPDGDIGVLAGLNRTDPILEKQLMGRPRRVGPESRPDVDGFSQPKRRRSIRAVERRACHRRPEPVPRWKWCHRVIGSAGPLNAFLQKRVKWLEPQHAVGPQV